VGHPVNNLSDVVHQRARLGVLAILHETVRAEFGYLRDALELTDGNLSRHLAVLEGAGLISVEKGYEGKRPRTWVKITKTGRRAFEEEIGALKSLVRRAERG
jgi:DNA-binding MarR family transcriptional regulator